MQNLKKVVIIGPESTGKSTLAQQLAEHYNTAWCPEFAREYLQQHGKEYNYDDLLKIAMGQITLEDSLITAAKDFYFIDTDMHVMKVWCEVAFQDCHKWILEQIALRKYDLFLLCNIDLPWLPDPLREYPELEIRQRIYAMYKDLMINQETPWVEISGDYNQRLHIAISAVNTILEK
jgi:NadR type nicotinamide-nucleotide adenylyltransferase